MVTATDLIIIITVHSKFNRNTNIKSQDVHNGKFLLENWKGSKHCCHQCVRMRVFLCDNKIIHFSLLPMVSDVPRKLHNSYSNTYDVYDKLYS